MCSYDLSFSVSCIEILPITQLLGGRIIMNWILLRKLRETLID